MQSRKLFGLVLAGGHSRRMGQEKAWLEVEGESLALRACRKLKEVCDQVFLSVRDLQFEQASRLVLASQQANQQKIEVLVDELQEIGPAAALLIAYERDAEASWFVFACDFVLADSKSFLDLKLVYEKTLSLNQERVSCYENSNQFLEPLFAIWTPAALQKLKKNVQENKSGPSLTLKTLSPLSLKPHHPDILLNANDPAAWNIALKKLVQKK